jgi:acyl-coenzyme A synthetase/AMP-(fatty) acid ligase
LALRGEPPAFSQVVTAAARRSRATKNPRSIDFVESLPRLFNGKIDKKALRAPYWQGQERQFS